jgi:hypothetical protein
MKPHFDQQTDPKLIIPQFMAYTKQQLIDFGIPKAEIPIYENANPSWMSVLGLLRYWKKRAAV